jgi:Glycosyl hydrolase family 10
VVNESINDRGDRTTENLQDSSWVRAIVPDYLTMAFKLAHAADPDAQLYYNDYNIERGAAEGTLQTEPKSTSRLRELASRSLRAWWWLWPAWCRRLKATHLC